MIKNSKKVNWKHLTLELFVVFLGVTAGFILNNWRGNVKEGKQEIQYLQGFREDAQSNIESLQESIVVDSLWIERATPQMNSLREDEFSRDSADVVISLLSSYSAFGARKGTWEDITNSGNLNLIEDFHLKKQIVDYHMSIESIEFIDDYLFEFFDRTLSSFIMSEFSFINQRAINPDIGSTAEFGNVFLVYFALLDQRYNAYRDLMQESDSLRLSLNNKLDFL